MGRMNRSPVPQLTTSMNYFLAFITFIPFVLLQAFAIVLHIVCSIVMAVITAPFALALLIYALLTSNNKDDQ